MELSDIGRPERHRRTAYTRHAVVAVLSLANVPSDVIAKVVSRDRTTLYNCLLVHDNLLYTKDKHYMDVWKMVEKASDFIVYYLPRLVKRADKESYTIGFMNGVEDSISQLFGVLLSTDGAVDILTMSGKIKEMGEESHVGSSSDSRAGFHDGSWYIGSRVQKIVNQETERGVYFISTKVLSDKVAELKSRISFDI
jgi:hypothetical protein